MKRLLLALLLIPFIGFAQGKISDPKLKGTVIKNSEGKCVANVFELWGLYLEDCNSLVADTVIQLGTVTCKYKPVLQGGKVVHFVPVPVDTVWKKCECREYKNPDYRGLTVGWRENYLISESMQSSGAVFTNANYSTSYSGVSSSYSSSEVNQQFTLSITRKQYCQIKLRQATWEDFWNRWCKEKGIVGFN